VTGKIDSTTAAWVHDLIAGLYGFLHTIFGNVIHAWDDFYDSAKAAAQGIWHFADEVGQAFYYLWHIWWPEFRHWIYVNILEPLYHAVDWIAHEGAVLWYYLTHPAKYVDLIWDYLLAKFETTIEDTSKKLGSFILSWIIHNLDDFVQLVEDVIDAVF